MKSKYLKPFIKNITSIKVLQALLRITVDGYLFHNGWLNSIKGGKPVNGEGSPIPWLTYPSIDFLAERINKSHRLFEYGSGNSSLYFSKYVKEVISAENHEGWYNYVKTTLPENANVILETDVIGGKYASLITTLEGNFDIVLVDGRDRVNCCKKSHDKLSDTGVLILDNSDRLEYVEAFNFMNDKGYKHLNFWGIAPGFIDRSCTTVFYKVENCFGL